MKRVYLLLILLLGAWGSYSQGISGTHASVPMSKYGNFRITDTSLAYSYSSIEGSPYLSEEFVEGNVFNEMNSDPERANLRYNMYTDKIEFKGEQDQVFELLNPEEYESFEFGDYHFVYESFNSNKRELSGYLQLIVSGDVNLYKRFNVEFRDAEESNSYKEPEPAQFDVNSPSYLISVSGGSIELMSKKKIEKQLIEYLPELKEYIKDNNLNSREEADLIQIVEFCN